jgi:putrescine aminotransferase
MHFAFLVHPISEATRQLLDLDPAGNLKRAWGRDLLSYCGELHRSVHGARQRGGGAAPAVRVIDELPGLVTPCGARAEGRLYEIPLGAREMLEDPTRAIDHILEAVEMAAKWGAKIIGLGAMTGVVGSQGTYVAEHAPVAITTGNSLTVYAALETLRQACAESELDLARETVAVVGVPGSIASVAARLLAPRCRSLLLVARGSSARACQLADQLQAELLFDIPQALRRARIVLTATSSGDCLDQQWLAPGSIVVDVGIPTDVQGSSARRSDALILSGGLARVPPTMSLDSNYLWFHHGMAPSCLSETVVLALENRAENFSLGRRLCPQRVEEIGAVASKLGFDFSRLFSFGLPLQESALVEFRKAVGRLKSGSGNGRAPRRQPAPTPAQLAPRAASLHARYINPVLVELGAPSGFVKTFVRGQGIELWDAEGRRYLDFVAGFGALNLGHNHPAVVEAVREALTSAAPGFTQAAINPYAAALAEQLVTVAPPGLEMVFFANSGAEAVEAALKLARCATARDGLLSCERSYHGKTLGALSVTGNPEYQRPFRPLLDDCRAVPFGDLAALEQALAARSYAAFVVEPVQAEGGIRVPPPAYLREAHRLCRQSGTLLVVDEVQTGLGRTGTMFAVERAGVEPDVMTLAKSLGGGLVPIGAMLCRRDLWIKAYGTAQTFALHTSTFGGGSLACAAGLATLKALGEEHLAANADARGRQLLAGLIEICRQHDALCEARGQGLLLGLEFKPLPAAIKAHWKQTDGSRNSALWVPNLETMLDAVPALFVVYNLLQAHGIFAQTTRSNPCVLRIEPPLGITSQQVDEFLAAVAECCGETDFSNRMFDGIIAKSGMGQHQAGRPRPHNPAAAAHESAPVARPLAPDALGVPAARVLPR